MEDESPLMYENFPVKISSETDYYSRMNIEVTYLKDLSRFDSVRVDITDFYSDENISSNELSDTYKVILTNAELDRYFKITVTESKDGNNREYVRVIKTFANRADVPNNVSVKSVDKFDGIAASELEIVELNEADEEIINNDGKEYEFLNTRNSYTILPEEFPNFYNSLPENKLYKVFAFTDGGVADADYKGFISTFPGGRERDVYVPAYMTYTVDELTHTVRRAAEHDYSNSGRCIKDQKFSVSQIKEQGEKNIYDIMDDRTIRISADDDSDRPCLIFSFNVLYTMDYHVDVYGADDCVNIETWTSEYKDGELQEPYYLETRYALNRAAYTFQALPCKMYYAVYFTDKEKMKSFVGGTASLRITAMQYSNEGNNYFTDMVGNKNLLMENNVVISDCIDYVGDVDLYYLDNTNESGKFWFSVENAPSTAGASSRSDYALTVKLCKVWESSNGVKTRYLRSELVEKTVDPGRKKTFIFNLEPDYDYFVYIYSSKPTFVLSEGDKYKVKVMGPSTGDSYEPNNTFETAKQITGDDDQLNDAWLHKNDADFYKFTTTEQRIFFAGLNAVNSIVYNLSLYDNEKNILATAEKDSSIAYIENIKLDPGTYYVKVDASGLGESAYFIEGNYRLYVSPEDFYAEFENPVSLNYNVKETFNINNYWSSILDEAYCRVGGMTYRRTEVTDNSELFVMNGSNKLPFTAETLASLPNGTYTVIMEFFGKASIGQPITLTVTGNSVTEGETVVLNTVIMEPNSNANWHWAACAKMMANSRLRREGSAVSTLSLAQGINGAFGSSHLTSIGDIEETAQLASYFYCGNKESYNFINGTVSLDGFEQSVLGVLKTGQAIIAKLENASSGSVKYVVIYGVNTGMHQYKIMDPQGSVDTWIDAENLYSGYGGDTGMVFNGQIVECL